MVKKRILIVDDLAIYRDPVVFALEGEGYKTLSAQNGLEALHIIKSQVIPFSLMIVDFSMPEMNGLDFLSAAKKYDISRDVPSIMLTDMADKSIIVKAAQLGVKDYILKTNFNLAELIAKVGAHIKNHNS